MKCKRRTQEQQQATISSRGMVLRAATKTIEAATTPQASARNSGSNIP
jgi:hypothetical protein